MLKSESPKQVLISKFNKIINFEKLPLKKLYSAVCAVEQYL